MALQSPSHPMFAQVPDEFFSPFPSNDSLLSGKYQALTGGTAKLSEELATLHQAKAFNVTLQMLQKTRATQAGDLLTDWLPEVAWFKEEAGVKLLQGIFAEVPWTKTSDPQQLVEDMGRVGLDAALTAMAAVPRAATTSRCSATAASSWSRHPGPSRRRPATCSPCNPSSAPARPSSLSCSTSRSTAPASSGSSATPPARCPAAWSRSPAWAPMNRHNITIEKPEMRALIRFGANDPRPTYRSMDKPRRDHGSRG